MAGRRVVAGAMVRRGRCGIFFKVEPTEVAVDWAVKCETKRN